MQFFKPLLDKSMTRALSLLVWVSSYLGFDTILKEKLKKRNNHTIESDNHQILVQFISKYLNVLVFKKKNSY